jgi:dihydrofolate synthase / folylpolyglutamate synthase
VIVSDSSLDWIHRFDRFDGRKGIKPGLERMEAMLEGVGNPHRGLRFLHVAGTNGKGSTCAYLAAILEDAGYRVGLYTSPYLSAFYDRMAVGGMNISPEQLERFVAELRPVVDRLTETPIGRPTEFEVVTTLALMHYGAEQVDAVVWETGLGGRLDSTNVVTPLLSLITNVGRDHERILGDTLEKIAAEKAGIIKPGVPVLTTAEGVALDVIERTAEEQKSPCFIWKKDFAATRTNNGWDGQEFDWQGFGTELPGLQIALLGPHQILNASLAVAAIRKLADFGFVISEDALRRGLLRTRWAGRLEAVRQQPLTLLDGAHNPEGAAALATALRELLPEHRRVVTVVGILADKAIPDVLAPVVALSRHLIVTCADTPRAADPEAVAAVIRELAPDVTVETTASVEAALQLAENRLQTADDVLLVTGSLYTISEARVIYVK